MKSQSVTRTERPSVIWQAWVYISISKPSFCSATFSMNVPLDRNNKLKTKGKKKNKKHSEGDNHKDIGAGYVEVLIWSS